MGITKVTRNYQITLPNDIRKITGIRVGDDLIVDVDKKEIRIRKMESDALGKAFGSWKDMEEDSVEYVKKIRNDSEKRMKRLGL